jgi:sarcosine oxidase subunit gamma
VLEPQNLPLPSTGTVSLAPPCSILSIAAFQGQEAALQAALGVALPTTPRGITAGPVTWLWSGPNSWLALSAEPIEISAAAKSRAAVTDQSDGRAIIRVTGPHAAQILAKLVPIDLHESTFAPDATALTLAGHIVVQLWRDEHGYNLTCFRSFAESLHESLSAASRASES